MRKIRRLILKFGYPMIKLYWFIWRPKTYGAKVILACDGEVLLIKHSYGGSNWTLPGGGVKKGEEIFITAKRELEEELGISVTNFTELGSFVRTEEYKIDTVFVLKAEISIETKERLKIDKVEIIEAQWFKINNLPKLNKTNQKILSFK